MEQGAMSGSGSSDETPKDYMETQRAWAARANAEANGESFGGVSLGIIENEGGEAEQKTTPIVWGKPQEDEQQDESNQVLFLRQQRLFAWRLWWQYFSDPLAWHVAQQTRDHTRRVNEAFSILVRMLPGHVVEDRPIFMGSLTAMGSLYEIAWMIQSMPNVKTFQALNRVIHEVEENDDIDYIIVNIRSTLDSLTARYRERLRQSGDPNYATKVPPNIQEDVERVFFAGQIAYVALLTLDLSDLGSTLLPSGTPFGDFALVSEFDVARQLYESLIDSAIRIDDDQSPLVQKQQQQQQQQQEGEEPESDQRPYANKRGTTEAPNHYMTSTRPPSLKRQQSRLVIDPMLEAKILIARNEAAKQVSKKKKGVSAVFTPDGNKSVKEISVTQSMHKRTGSGTVKLNKKERAKNRLSWVKPNNNGTTWISSNGSSSFSSSNGVSAVAPTTPMTTTSLAKSISSSGSNPSLPDISSSPRSFVSVAPTAAGVSSPRLRNSSSGSNPLGSGGGSFTLAESRARTNSVARPEAAAAAAAASSVAVVVMPTLPIVPPAPLPTPAVMSPLTLSQWTSMFQTPLDIYVFCDRYISSIEQWINGRPMEQLKTEGMHPFIRDCTSVSTLAKSQILLNRVLYEVCQQALTTEMLYDIDFLSVLHPFALSMLNPEMAYKIQNNGERMLRNRSWVPKDAKPSFEESSSARIIALLDAMIAAIEQKRLVIETEISTQLLVDLNEDPRMLKISTILRDFRIMRTEHMREFAKPPPPPPQRAAVIRSLTTAAPERRTLRPESTAVHVTPVPTVIDDGSDSAGSDNEDTSGTNSASH